MGKVSKRRCVMTSAATIALSSAAIGSFASSPPLDTSSSDAIPPSAHSLSTAFSCGSHWRKAQACSTLCPTGQDSVCPDGESCYAGIPCTGESSSSESNDNMDYILKRQAQMEKRELNRLKRKREEEHVDRFVCGESYVEAAESCGGNAAGSSSSAVEGSGPSEAQVQYCPTGSSSQCPSGMQCYAAVSCSRDSHHEEALLSVEEVSVRLSDSLLAIEQQPPSLLSNSTTATREGNHAVLTIEEGYSSIMKRTVSALLSSRYGLN